MREIVIIGAGGAAREIIDILDDIRTEGGPGEPSFAVSAVLDDAANRWGSRLRGIPILGGISAVNTGSAALIIAVASHRNLAVRLEIVERLGLPADRYPRLVHPTARVSRHASVGPGSVVAHYAVVGPDVVVGAHVFVAQAVTLGHDALVRDGAIIGPQAAVAGSVEVGAGAYLGAGSLVREGVRIGDGALVGMGSVVTRDVAPGAVVAGNPARPLRSPN